MHAKSEVAVAHGGVIKARLPEKTFNGIGWLEQLTHALKPNQTIRNIEIFCENVQCHVGKLVKITNIIGEYSLNCKICKKD